jgi:hypothetical protein
MFENTSSTGVDVKFGGSGTTNSGASTDGMTLPAGSQIKLDCSAAIYVVAPAGLTANIQYIYGV